MTTSNDVRASRFRRADGPTSLARRVDTKRLDSGYRLPARSQGRREKEPSSGVGLKDAARRCPSIRTAQFLAGTAPGPWKQNSSTVDCLLAIHCQLSVDRTRFLLGQCLAIFADVVPAWWGEKRELKTPSPERKDSKRRQFSGLKITVTPKKMNNQTRVLAKPRK